MSQTRDTWVYQLKDEQRIVYYGISNNPDRRSGEHSRSRKCFTHHKVISRAVTRECAIQREATEIQRYQKQHGGLPPKYNRSKTCQFSALTLRECVQ